MEFLFDDETFSFETLRTAGFALYGGAGKIVLFGYSLGGYLVARAAAFEHRVAALILDDGIHDFHAAFAGNMPPFIESWIEEGRDDVAVPVLTMLTAVSTNVRWGLRNGMWVFGTDSFADLVRTVKDYTLDGIAHQIAAPTLIMDPENDHNLNGQPQLVEQALTGAPTTLVTLTEDEGAGEHTHAGGLGRAHQTMFDWLDATLTSDEDNVTTEPSMVSEGATK